MKIIGIDIDALNAQAACLRDQLAGIETVIRIASENPVAIPEAPKPNGPVKPPLRAETVQAPRKFVNIGARKAILLALHTGPASDREIGRALVWQASMVRTVLSSMLSYGIVSVSEGGVYALTEKGRGMAQWHISHPEYVTHCPSRQNGARG